MKTATCLACLGLAAGPLTAALGLAMLLGASAAGRDHPVTVIELTLDQPVPDGSIVGSARQQADRQQPQ